jgi:hypothetical protein
MVGCSSSIAEKKSCASLLLVAGTLEVLAEGTSGLSAMVCIGRALLALADAAVDISEREQKM